MIEIGASFTDVKIEGILEKKDIVINVYIPYLAI